MEEGCRVVESQWECKVCVVRSYLKGANELS